ncbi:MAG: SMP-30/gluconolactonase/LRE family protein, partial [Chloroflexota bacterium]|nr:SMP-30/gluconolactonase/LRE family protein [Chloroflexota bacterium]
MSYGKTKIFATGFEFPEGPSFDRAGNLYIMDSGQRAIPRVSPDGETSIFARSEGGPNGSAFHRNGDLYVAEPGARRVAKVSPTADLHVLADEFEGEPFLAPNDITFDLEGRAYFSDPDDSDVDDPYGRVFRLDPNGEVHLVAAQMAYPNGLAVTPDGGHLIVAETFSEKLLRCTLDPGGDVTAREEFAYVGTGREDEVG